MDHQPQTLTLIRDMGVVMTCTLGRWHSWEFGKEGKRVAAPRNPGTSRDAGTATAAWTRLASGTRGKCVALEAPDSR